MSQLHSHLILQIVGLGISVICRGASSCRHKLRLSHCAACLRVKLVRHAEPREIANAVVFLDCPAASLMTDAVLTADAGATG
jgi:NAD(P)-dependent dehydrogenase (short-subunit alcohol dehydrogenase family)